MWLMTVVAATVVAASLLAHHDLVAQDRRRSREANGALAELAAARLDGALHDLLSTLETAAASAPPALDQRTAALRARGTATAVARVAPDGRTPTAVIGDAGTLDAVPRRVLDAAR